MELILNAKKKKKKKINKIATLSCYKNSNSSHNNEMTPQSNKN